MKILTSYLPITFDSKYRENVSYMHRVLNDKVLTLASKRLSQPAALSSMRVVMSFTEIMLPDVSINATASVDVLSTVDNNGDKTCFRFSIPVIVVFGRLWRFKNEASNIVDNLI